MKISLPKINIDKTWLMLGVAVMLSVLAAWLTLKYLDYKTSSIEAEVTAKAQQGKGEPVAVVVPTRNLPPGTILDESMVAAREVPTDFVYDDTIRVDEFDAFKGQALIKPVTRGRPLRRPDVREIFKDFAGTVPEGKRAMTIDIDELNSIANMVQPGNLVDLMLVLAADASPAGLSGAGGGIGGTTGSTGQSVVPFMEKMKVLATGQTVTHEGQDLGAGGAQAGRRITYSNLTLEVTPSQAARLTLAHELGKMRAVLRNEKDPGEVDFGLVNARNMLADIQEKARRRQAIEVSSAPAGSSGGVPPGFVEYIIGGKGGGGVGQPMNVPLPEGIGGATATVPASAASATDEKTTDLTAALNTVQKQIAAQFGGAARPAPAAP